MAGLDIDLKPIKGDDKAALAEMSGAIDGNTVPSFQSTLEEIQGKGVQRLVLDMSKIKYVNSTGLGSLVKYADAFKNSGGGMALIKVPAKVKIVIEMLGLNAFFEICADLNGALGALGGGAPAPEKPKKVEKKPVESSGTLDRPRPLKGGGGPKPDPTPMDDPFAPAPATSGAASGGGAVAATGNGGGPVSFPYTTSCGSCGVKLRFTRQGAYKCPRCHTHIKLNGSGGPVFTRPNKPAGIAVTLPARQECAEGLLHLATTVVSQSVSGPALDAVRQSIFEVAQMFQSYIYQNNPDGMYHVTIDAADGRVDVRFADHGTSVDASRLSAFFPNATRYMDHFECSPHPSGGNIIRMSKG